MLKWTAILPLQRGQGCTWRGETPALCGSLGCRRPPEPPPELLPLPLPLPCPTIFLSNRLCSPACCSWTREGGRWNFGMLIVDLVRAVTNNRCLVLANTIISWHATLLTWIFKGAFPFNLQTQIIPDFGAGVFLSNTTRESGWLYKISAQKKTWRRGECVLLVWFCLALASELFQKAAH